MINESNTSTGKDENSKRVKCTEVILHSYTLTRDAVTKTWNYKEELNPNLNDGKRHHTRGFIIAYDDKPYPSLTKLRNMLDNATITSHSNIKNPKDYGSKLRDFCPTCLNAVKKECKTKFSDW